MNEFFFITRAQELKVIIENIHTRAESYLANDNLFHYKNKMFLKITQSTLDLNIRLAEIAKGN